MGSICIPVADSFDVWLNDFDALENLTLYNKVSDWESIQVDRVNRMRAKKEHAVRNMVYYFNPETI